MNIIGSQMPTKYASVMPISFLFWMKLPSMLLPILRASNCAVDAAHKTKSSLSTRKLTAIGLKGEDEE
jgi:hypothetical protein